MICSIDTQCLPTHLSHRSEREVVPTERVAVSNSVYCGVAIIGKLPESPRKLPGSHPDDSGSPWLCLFWEAVVFFSS